MTRSVFERALGPAVADLPEPLRTHVSAVGAGIGEGVFASAGCTKRMLRPLLRLLARRGVLFPDHGTDVPFRIVNTPTADGGLHTVRTFRFPAGDRVLEDTLRVVDGHLHDFLGRRNGLEVHMLLTVDEAGLRMRSGPQWVRAGRLRVRVPRLARVTVLDTVADGRRHIDVRLRTPMLGEWFRYAGEFAYEVGGGSGTPEKPRRGVCTDETS